MEQKILDEISEKVEKGGVHVRTICEILGGPKEYVENSIKLLVEKVKEAPYMTLVKGEVFPAKEVDSLFSAFAEMEIVFKKKENMFDFCYSFMPSSIEIVAPESLDVTSAELSNFLNDFQGRLHATDKVAKESNALKQLLSKRQAQIIRYNILAHLIDKELTRDELKKRVGIDEKSFSSYLDVLLNRGEILQDGNILKLSEIVKFNEPEKSS